MNLPPPVSALERRLGHLAGHLGDEDASRASEALSDATEEEAPSYVPASIAETWRADAPGVVLVPSVCTLSDGEVGRASAGLTGLLLQIVLGRLEQLAVASNDDLACCEQGRTFSRPWDHASCAVLSVRVWAPMAL